MKLHRWDTFANKLDLVDPCRCLKVQPGLPEDWLILSFTWENWAAQQPITMHKDYYVDLFLLLSLCSSPAVFNEYTVSPKHGMWVNCIPSLLPYLDNYFFANSTDSHKF